ncbi:Cd(II)/Pb(II)-responsive transcriptional regulator [Plasticicumulans acidivorans]|uniref:Cd(II)/Pb(II)-responsive transcriptional regulator n=1 Tax=Plasticicumulans acidivorans TaxID=886464 RepID=A0A317MX61_9GAMM|nr:Cd(II)/Pb(II)-responsive transcriptional regulator [Plasticicumulans acidivorans]PWV63207.1 Cd(II)/Pb(II)-responsive transcriptional regulator [Plasticicumulans acidivorans]
MRIGELARHAGTEVETVRYYEREGLLPPPPRDASGYRRYGPAQLQRLAFIRHCRAFDMPLAEIRELLDFLAAPERSCQHINDLIDQHLARVRTRIAGLQALERQLSELRSHCASGQRAADCGILQELLAALPADDAPG